MHSEASIEIDRPIDDVFRLTNDDVAKWSIVVVEEEIIEANPDGVGTTFRTVTEDHGQQIEFLGEVTRYEPPRFSAVRLMGKPFDIEAEYTFEDLDGQTRVTQVSHVQGKGLYKFFFACFGWMMRKSSCNAVSKELASLKAYCESQP